MMSLSIVDILRQARELLSVPERWTQGTCARDQQGRGVSLSDPTAVCWCVYGAVAKIGELYGATNTADADTLLIISAGLDPTEQGMAAFNDLPTTTHADVLTLFDRAIASEESR